MIPSTYLCTHKTLIKTSVTKFIFIHYKVYIFSWFCHFDDDQYVNVAALEAKLRQFEPSSEWYLGKPSIGRPLDILDRESPEVEVSFHHC